jgi:4-carboxymuconolactone decarboxylase
MSRSRPSRPRLAPLAPDELDANQADALAAVNVGGQTVNIFATLVRHPGLFRKWMPFGGKLLAGKLPPRDRELLILRVGWRCQAEYEWAQHVPIGRSAGLTDAEIERIKAGPYAQGWDEFDSALLRAADELKDDSCITDHTWALLADRYDERQLIEVLMVVGQYQLVSGALNSLGVQLEPGVVGFDATEGAGS